MFSLYRLFLMTTSLRSALDALLGAETLEQFVRSRRPDTAWRKIALDLYDRTAVSVTHESLRAWFPDEDREAVA